MPTHSTSAGCPRGAPCGAREVRRSCVPPPGQPYTRDGLGAVNDHMGEPVVLCRRRTRRREGAERWQALVDKHPTGTVSVAWDHADTHAEAEGEAVGRAAAGRLVRLYLPTDSPWLTPLERLGRQCRRDGTHGELFGSLAALLEAVHACFDRYHRHPERIFSIIGASTAYFLGAY